MWVVYYDKIVDSLKYGKRTVSTKIAEGSYDECARIAESTPNAYIAWACY